MGGKLTAYVICRSQVMWESIDSCRSFCDETVICDIGMDDESLRIVSEYQKLKGSISVRHYREEYEAMMDSGDSGWSFYLSGNEVVHEDSYHYLWDISKSHEEFDAVAVDMVVASSGVNGWQLGKIETLKMFNSDRVRWFSRSGFSCPTNRKMKIAPAGLCPKPVWSVSFGGSHEGGVSLYDVSGTVPKSLFRLAGRVMYACPFVT